MNIFIEASSFLLFCSSRFILHISFFECDEQNNGLTMNIVDASSSYQQQVLSRVRDTDFPTKTFLPIYNAHNSVFFNHAREKIMTFRRFKRK